MPTNIYERHRHRHNHHPHHMHKIHRSIGSIGSIRSELLGLIRLKQTKIGQSKGCVSNVIVVSSVTAVSNPTSQKYIRNIVQLPNVFVGLRNQGNGRKYLDLELS
jgi:hypothetical protein